MTSRERSRPLARRLTALGALVALGVSSSAVAVRPVAAAADPITLRVDATEAPRRILHAHLAFPVSPGPVTLQYPKWIPGEHAPTGPINDLAGLTFTAGGRTLAWQRDSVDLYGFHVTVPDGASQLDVALDCLMTTDPAGYSSAASVTENLLILSWNQMVLYPAGVPAAELTYAPSLKLPEGWRHATALDVVGERDGVVEFQPVSLERLVDSPVLAGRHFRAFPLATELPQKHELDVVAESEADLAAKPADIAKFSRLVREARALFGGWHYRRYHFLLTLSEGVAHFGLEHHESSDDRVSERMLVDADRLVHHGGLLPHEVVHSWNGKYRRPAGLATATFQEPMRDELLWVYEGLTSYLGYVLTGRSGLRSPGLMHDDLARFAAQQDAHVGRRWRPLKDTAISAPLLYDAPNAWEAWRRDTDFYDEGALIWLEADATIRRLSKGRRSLDDFCRLFCGPPSGPPEVRPYTFDDVLGWLAKVQPYDWRGFFTTRLEQTGTGAPLGGLEAAGWRLVYRDSASELHDIRQGVRKQIDLSYSIGLLLSEEGEVVDVVPGSAGATAGIGPGMKLLAVNGRRFSADVLHEAIRATRTTEPIDLLLENNDFLRTFHVEYHGGERYPHLERIAGRPDLLAQILRPHTRSGR